jgi:hypothetical protein
VVLRGWIPLRPQTGNPVDNPRKVRQATGVFGPLENEAVTLGGAGIVGTNLATRAPTLQSEASALMDLDRVKDGVGSHGAVLIRVTS